MSSHRQASHYQASLAVAAFTAIPAAILVTLRQRSLSSAQQHANNRGKTTYVAIDDSWRWFKKHRKHANLGLYKVLESKPSGDYKEKKTLVSLLNHLHTTSTA